MIRCQSCGNENLDSSQYCDECGTKLRKESITHGSGTVDAAIHRTESALPPAELSASVEGPSSSGVPAKAVANESPSENGSHKGEDVHAILMIERGESASTEFVIKGNESNIGRWDADNGVFPDVDLDTHDADAKVSRRHARIIRRGNSYFLEDQGSTNGTFVNRGRRLLPGVPHELADGDEIIVGKTFLRFRIAK